MKKIFRMALVFALAGATLMYTGCTKDYDEDINGLNTQVANLTSQHAADVAKLSGDISSAVSSLQTAYKAADSAIETAYKAADSALEDAFKAADTELANAIAANKADIAANKAAIEANAALLDAYKKLIDNNAAAIAVNANGIAALNAALENYATKAELDAAKEAAAAALAAAKAELETAIAKCATKDELDAAKKAAEDALAAAKAELEAAIANCATKAELASLKAELAALIDANAKAIEDLEAAVAKCATKDELKAEVDALKAEIAKCATKDELTALQNKLEGELSALETKLQGYVDTKVGDLATELTGKINSLETSMKTFVGKSVDDAKVALQNEFNEKIATANKSLDDAKAILLNELRSIVFVPELYYAGIEATAYTWTEVTPLAMVKATAKDAWEDEEGTEYSFAVGAEISANATRNSYALSQLASADYNINPSTFNVEDAAWTLTGKNYKNIFNFTRADSKTWEPVFESISAKNGVATVRYTIKNADKLPATLFAGFSEKVAEDIANDFKAAVFAAVEMSQKSIVDDIIGAQIDALLIAAVTDLYGKTGSLEEAVKALQEYAEQLKKSLGEKEGNIALKTDLDNIYDEIDRVEDEAESKINKLYNLFVDALKGGDVAIMHLTATLKDGRDLDSDYEAIVSDYEDFNALAFTKESKYKTNTVKCDEGWHLYTSAKQAIENEASVKVKYDGKVDLDVIDIHMLSSVNEEYAASLAKLQEVYPNLSMDFSLVPYYAGDEKTLESAYGKLDGTMFYPMAVEADGTPVAPKDSENGGISSVGRMPVVLVKLFNGKDVVLAGYFKVEITDVDAIVTEDTIVIPAFDAIPFICAEQTLKTTWSQFSRLVIEHVGCTYENFLKLFTLDGKELKQGETYYPVMYTDEACEKDSKGAFATVKYSVDAKGTVVNDAFEITINKDQAAAIAKAGGSQDLYIKFNNGEYNVVRIKFTVKVAEAAKFNFGANKIENEWHTEIDNEELNTVKVNVHVPSFGDEGLYTTAVLNYQRDLDHYFVGKNPSIDLDEASQAVYGKVDAKLLDKNYTYTFAAKQPKINGVQFKTNAAGNALYAGEVKEANLIATISEDGKTIKYNNGDIAKKYLNLWSYAYDQYADQDKMLYANIHVNVTYGECAIPAGENDFHARFLRPLDITWGGNQTIEESPVGGANIKIGEFLAGIKDWNNQKVVKVNADEESENFGKLEANVIADVDMYKYYQFKSLVVDLKNVKRDGWKVGDSAAQELVSKITPDAKLTLEGTTNDVVTIDITDIAKLNDVVVNYKNDEAYIKTFNMYFPVKVVYSWGEIEDVLKVTIKNTSETEEK